MGPTSYPRKKIRILLLEKIHQAAVSQLDEAGYSVEQHDDSLSDDELLKAIKDVHVLGIRSKTEISSRHFEAAERLLTVGCFSVGTNQVDLEAAARHGVPVFNAPYSNTRSVAELTIANIIMLARRAADKSRKMHQGQWEKSAAGSHEVRHKTLGVIGYGHIGQQVGIIAESLGMRVLYFDTIKKLSLGSAQAVSSQQELFKQADIVTLHVPAQEQNRPLITAKELAQMKAGSCLLNLSRGSVVDLAALKDALSSKRLHGAAVDVYPEEPKQNIASFECALAGMDNVILTPHIGGSTEEAQHNIGLEVASSFVKFIDNGATTGSVNFPQIDLPAFPDAHRILNVHKNEPGVLMEVNKIISELGANIDAQYLSTYGDIGYLIVDLNKGVADDVKVRIEQLPENVRTRILY